MRFGFYLYFVREYLTGLLFRKNLSNYEYNKTAIREYYERISRDSYRAEHTASKDEPFYSPIFKSTEINNLLNGNKDVKLLDVGCGFGDLFAVLSSVYNVKYSGIDAAYSPLTYASHKYSPECKFVTAEAEAIPVRSESYDIVLSVNVLPYVLNIVAFQSELARVTRNNGLVALLFPIPSHFWETSFEGISLLMHQPSEIIEASSKLGLRLVESHDISFYPIGLKYFKLNYGKGLVFRKTNYLGNS